MVFTTTSAPASPLDYSDLGYPKWRRLHDEFSLLALGSPRFAWNLSGRPTVSFAIVIACEFIHRRSEGLGWVGKARRSKGFATPTRQSILGRS
jgi:hypothetical protein